MVLTVGCFEDPVEELFALGGGVKDLGTCPGALTIAFGFVGIGGFATLGVAFGVTALAGIGAYSTLS